MSGKLSEVYDAYDVEILQTFRGRGAVLLKTDKGIMQLKQLEVSEKRIVAEYMFKEQLYEQGFKLIDRCIMNNEQELVTYDRYDNPYVLKHSFEGKECNVNSREEVIAAVENLAILHKACKSLFDNIEKDVHIRINMDFAKRNAELKRVKSFVLKQCPKREFEQLYIAAYDYYYEQALKCEQDFIGKDYIEGSEHLGYCHGMYNHHSVIILPDNAGIATINFDKFYVGNQLADLYHFIRKITEKNDYDSSLTFSMIEKYNSICSLNKNDMEYIYTCFCYPEKFYKISNQYINSSKNWISPKMIEKIKKITEDEAKKIEFLEKFKSYIRNYFTF